MGDINLVFTIIHIIFKAMRLDGYKCLLKQLCDHSSKLVVFTFFEIPKNFQVKLVVKKECNFKHTVNFDIVK